MALLCIVCKAACGFGGVATDEGPLCESCAVSESSAAPASAGADPIACPPGCVRVKGHPGFHTTHPDIAKKEDVVLTQNQIAATTPEGRAEIFGVLAEAGEIDVMNLRAFEKPKMRGLIPSMEVEEWIYGAVAHAPHLSLMERLVLVRTPHEVHHRQDLAEGVEVCRFVVVLEWLPSAHPDARLLREIGPSFQPRMGTRADRAAALNTARAFAWRQATTLKAVGPMAYRAARELS